MSPFSKDKALGDCTPEKAFWSTHGVIVRNIYEMEKFLEFADEWTFRYHINLDNNKNDFADWIRDVLEDSDLANKLEGVMEKEKYLKIVKERIKELETH
jgi:hypothetical protein